ncbi:T20D4.11-like domain-containing protein [Caenorhabditis elegans]|uniref:T20D4.11-like domain-containing protein n=1 Tax=Caenorhabditis elegans TaxID=6239 RepID=P91516_CAEEL|nr:DUF19 domain-containing protein [Caenorhabditis elegans]CCD70574.1 DUF19 domain-containing protein [Caenorhabditis elegans]|eukprot:NP_503899.2 Uncharacterized protein CELE_T28A11.18 [Caenorhabditis elegans]
MIGFLKLAIIGTVFLGVVHQAVSTAAQDAGCTDEESLRTHSCDLVLADFLENPGNLDVKNKKRLKEYKDDCHNVLSCYNKIKCLGTNGEKIPAVKYIGKHCRATDYVHDDFAKCSDKLNAKKSTCFDDWDPIPNNVTTEKVPKKFDQLMSESCKTCFGKDNCMMKEIKETCGQQEWDLFRVHFIIIAGGFFDKCDFSRLD